MAFFLIAALYLPGFFKTLLAKLWTLIPCYLAALVNVPRLDFFIWISLPSPNLGIFNFFLSYFSAIY
nr:MAG TPA: hypothetical protein [Bacteriophage sp.]